MESCFSMAMIFVHEFSKLLINILREEMEVVGYLAGYLAKYPATQKGVI